MNELLRMVVTMYPKIVPPGAEELLMASISKATQEKLLNMDREKAAEIIAGAVNDVNHGSVKRIDDLINLRLN